MKQFFSWFKSEHKVKRWLLLALISVVAICYALSTIYVTNTLDIKTILKIVFLFVFGFAGVVFSYISMQKQTLENMVKQTDKRDNVKSLIYNKRVYSQGPKVVVIGGSGLNSILRGLPIFLLLFICYRSAGSLRLFPVTSWSKTVLPVHRSVRITGSRF